MDSAGDANLPLNVRKEFYNDYNLGLFERLSILAQKKNTTVSAVTLAALIDDTHLNTFAQIGPQNVNELLSSLTAAEVTITAEEREWLLLQNKG